MKLVGAAHAVLVTVFVCLCAAGVVAQDVNLKATYGEKELKAGFEPDPFKVKVEAGGSTQTELGGVKAWIEKAPDFRLVYEAGKYPLIFRVESKADTTLLVNLPDGTWLADDDSGGNLNPRIRIAQPKSGRYEIWVGTLTKDVGTPPAELLISEVK
jgi:hypothetical protein